MDESNKDPILSAIEALEKKYEEDKKNALAKQRQMYECQLQSLRNQMSPGTPYTEHPTFDHFVAGKNTPASTPSTMDTRAKERNELFKKNLATTREDIARAKGLVGEANFLSVEMGRETEFQATLRISPSSLSPNTKKVALNEPAILVKRKNRNVQVWAIQKFENKLNDMRKLYQERKEKGLNMKEALPSKAIDPFYESQENHYLIGAANVFLDCLFHDVKLDYQVPIISQQGKVAGRLHVEICRIEGNVLGNRRNSSETDADNNTSIKNNFHDISEKGDGDILGKQFTIQFSIKSASGLPPSLSHFVFCQYVFWGHPDSIVVPPVINAEHPASHIDRTKFCFDHVQEFVVNVTEEFVEYCTQGALTVEVWGHRTIGISNIKPKSDVDVQLMRSRYLSDRWSELSRKIELWVEIQEVNDAGEYAAVEVLLKSDITTGGVYQLRQGQQRRVVVRVKPIQDSGTLPVICEAITSVSIGGTCSRSKLQKPLDSYQEDDLTVLREKWSYALIKRRDYLDSEIEKIINKKGDISDQEIEREKSLLDQVICLNEERITVLVPTPKSGIPGAPADWNPPLGMEKHIPVIFLNLNADDVTVPMKGDAEVRVAGPNSILPKEHGSQFSSLPIIKNSAKEVSATAAWDSFGHDSVHLNRVTSSNDCIYLIIKTNVRLSHPTTMDLVLRKRIAVNVYRRQSISEMIKKIVSQDSLLITGVTYEVVFNIPKAFEDLENRETLALVAASGEDILTNDGESYLEKYARCTSDVESILMLDRLRQEVAVRELVTAQGRQFRKTGSVSNTIQSAKLYPDSAAGSACELCEGEKY